MKRTHGKTILLLAVIFLGLFFCRAEDALAEEMTDIRVGLVSLYSDVPQITVYNSSIAIGYSVDNSFYAETTLSGGSGYTFSCASGFFCEINKEYSSFKDAKKDADKITAKGIAAYPVFISRGVFKVYISGKKDRAAVEMDCSSCSFLGFSFSSVFGDNKQRILVEASSNAFIIDAGNSKAYPQIKACTSDSSGIKSISLGSRSYRGRIEIGRYGKNSITAINIINLEAYLASVVPCEMVSTWHPEALKAQAVVARSYAYANTGYGTDSDINSPYKIVDTTASQVYKGCQSETKQTTAAVIETKGKTLKFKGTVIPAYFYSTSGGATESGIDLWGLKGSCFRSVSDLYELSPEKQPWIYKTTYDEIRKKLENEGYSFENTPNHLYSKLLSESGRTLLLALTDGKKTTLIRGEKVRTALDLLSTKLRIVEYGDEPDKAYIRGSENLSKRNISASYAISSEGKVTALKDTRLEQYIAIGSKNMFNYPASAPASASEVYIAGMGYGHGVGLSQSGAKGMAEAGFNYKYIVEYYFPGAVCN